MSKKIKRQTFANKLAYFMVKELEIMNAYQLREVMRDCNSLTQSNCWWLEYHLKDVVYETAENQLQLFEDKDVTK